MKMALMERVGTLLRANLNDLVDRAEDPEKMLKQVILDMENQLLQVKTQVAISLADLHLLERRRDENAKKGEEWMHKAELAVAKQLDDLARAAIERSLEFGKLAGSFVEQIGDQKSQVDNLKSALLKLEGKLGEGRAKIDLLLAKHRRARAAKHAADAHAGFDAQSASSAWDRMGRKVDRSEAVGQASAELRNESAASVEDRFAALEKQQEVERLLADLKTRK
jgi:phage shock protein A